MIVQLHDYKSKIESCSEVPPGTTFVVVSGGFDPLHIGHVRYLKEASELRWDRGSQNTALIVVVNGDSFLIRKKGKPFMPLEERCEIIDEIKGVMAVVPYESESDTVVGALEVIRPHFFAKGGDRTGIENIPEWGVCQALGIRVATNVGGGKVQSSSWLVKGDKC